MTEPEPVIKWMSAKGGKWHIPNGGQWVAFRKDATALCGLTFEPFNVCDEYPPTTDGWICKRCTGAK